MDDEGDEGEEGMLPTRPNRPWTETPNDFDYKVFSESLTRSWPRRICVTTMKLTRLRAYLDAQLKGLQGMVTRLANRLQRRLMAQQNRSWDFDQEEGMLDAARLAYRRRARFLAQLQGRARCRVQGYDRHAADRQFRLDARAPDFHRGDFRRCSGAHAGTLRVKTEVLGFTTRAWKGGRAARHGWPRASRRIRGVSTTCAISCTKRPMNPGAGRARTLA
jgi:cobaltochelatase CobT